MNTEKMNNTDTPKIAAETKLLSSSSNNDDIATTITTSSITTVVYTLKRNAKKVKVFLEKHELLDKSYRLTNVNNVHDINTILLHHHHQQQQQQQQHQSHNTQRNYDHVEEETKELKLDISTCIAIPILSKRQTPSSCCTCIRIIPIFNTSCCTTCQCQCQCQCTHSNSNETIKTWNDNIRPLIIGYGKQPCLYSSATLGNTNKKFMLNHHQSKKNDSKMKHRGSRQGHNWNIIKHTLFDTAHEYNILRRTNQHEDSMNDDHEMNDIENQIDHLSFMTCPNKVEIIGDDRTVVLPSQALNIHTDTNFHTLIKSITTRRRRRRSTYHGMNHSSQDDAHDNDDNDDDTSDQQMKNFHTLLWKNIGRTYQSSRIVRRGEIDPNSKIRHSGHFILYIDENKDQDTKTDNDENKKGWITITEQKIKQSFDLTKVMFSRGNISEKIRFGQRIVQPNEIILDMYAGIGYYTLPALIYGKAKHVYACEWNPHAIHALKYNLKQNGLGADRATVIEGDSRISFKEDSDLVGRIMNKIDRVSLGLLPSSEGGWRTAIQALNKEKGGWIHVHGNVPVKEHEHWSLWTCQQLSKLFLEEASRNDDNDDDVYRCYDNRSANKDDNEGNYCTSTHNNDSNIKIGQSKPHPYVICNHLERVKSFAPKVDHLVADIFVGYTLPLEVQSTLDAYFKQEQGERNHPTPQEENEESRNRRKVGIIKSNSDYCYRNDDIEPPSCALNSGVLNQDWMKEI